MKQVNEIDGVQVWDVENAQPADRRYGVIHPKCGVNISKTATQDAAEAKARTHARKCRG